MNKQWAKRKMRDEEDEEGAVPVRRGDEPGNGANSIIAFQALVLALS